MYMGNNDVMVKTALIVTDSIVFCSYIIFPSSMYSPFIRFRNNMMYMYQHFPTVVMLY
jgi:hypothetical protein